MMEKKSNVNTLSHTLKQQQQQKMFNLFIAFCLGRYENKIAICNSCDKFVNYLNPNVKCMFAVGICNSVTVLYILFLKHHS